MTGGGGIDRKEWARVVDELIQTKTKGKIAPFARMVGVNARTVDRWLHREVAVTEESIRAVARALRVPPADLLVQVGYYHPDEITPPAVPDPYKDPIVREILANPDLSEEQQADLVEMQLRRMDVELDQRRKDYLRLIRVLGHGRESA